MDRLRTPKKHGRLVLAPSYRQGAFDSHAVDCPLPFRHAGHFRMTYIGWDGTGYQTGLASSDDLLTWTGVGSPGSIDSRYAHIPGITGWEGKLHHFHCAVAPATVPHPGEIEHNEVRGIASATGR